MFLLMFCYAFAMFSIDFIVSTPGITAPYDWVSQVAHPRLAAPLGPFAPADMPVAVYHRSIAAVRIKKVKGQC